jgi:hypothetical protein
VHRHRMNQRNIVVAVAAVCSKNYLSEVLLDKMRSD